MTQFYYLSNNGTELAGKIKETSAQQIKTALNDQSSKSLLLSTINSLSEEAKEILLEASSVKSDGKITKTEYVSKNYFWTGDHKMGHKTEDGFTRYSAALTDLMNLSLVIPKVGGRGQTYYITDKGRKIADLLRFPGDTQ